MLDEVKDYLHIAHDDADKLLIELIQEGIAVVNNYCGVFDIENNLPAKALVREYVRFAFNGMREHFYKAYKHDMIALSFDLWDLGDDDE